MQDTYYWITDSWGLRDKWDLNRYLAQFLDFKDNKTEGKPGETTCSNQPLQSWLKDNKAKMPSQHALFGNCLGIGLGVGADGSAIWWVWDRHPLEQFKSKSWYIRRN